MCCLVPPSCRVVAWLQLSQESHPPWLSSSPISEPLPPSSSVKWASSTCLPGLLWEMKLYSISHVPSSGPGTWQAAAGGYLVAGFAEGPPILLVEALPGQLAAAGAAGEALGMVLPPHGFHGQLSGGHSLVAEGTDVWGRRDTGRDLSSLGGLYLVTTQNMPRPPGLRLEPPGLMSAT